MLNTNKQIKKVILIALLAIFTLPSIVSADMTGSYGDDYYDGSGWGYSSGYSSPVYYDEYSYQPTYGYDNYDYGSYYSPSYDYGYSSPSYGSYSSPSYSYGGGYYGSSYVPSYGTSYGGSSIPSSNYNNNTSNSSSNSTSSSSATAVSNNTNVNNNNVYVYTNPTGNAVVYNPAHQNLNVYCVITPENPRLGQTVTATAYATGGIGNYTYSWGGDLLIGATGASTQFTSYTAGTKNITVTVRSDQEVITRSCSVTFQNNSTYYGSTINTGTPVSGVYVQKISSGAPVGGVYLNDLPSTGLSLNFFDYLVGFMILVLGAVFTFVTQAKKKLALKNI